MDVRTKLFTKRSRKGYIVTKYIMRDYEPSTEKQRKKVLGYVKKVYPDEKDLDCIMSYLGSALSWKGTQDQLALFLLGLGSSGKSFILDLTKSTMGCYFVQLGSDTFAGNTCNINKVLNTYRSDPQILFSWVNEPEDKKMNGSLFKVWVDGNLQSTMLYKEGQHNFQHYSRSITTANTMPHINVESGTTRRMISYTHKSDFTDDKTKVDESKHIYLLDKYIIKKMEETKLLDTWFDILVDYCYNWLKGKKPEYGDNFKETKDAIVSISDVFQDFMDSELTITNNPNDKIGKDGMRKAFLDMYPDKHLTAMQVKTSLTERKLIFKPDVRTNKIKGSYIGVKFRVEEEDDEEDYDNGIEKKDQSVDVIKLMKTKYDDLEAKYNTLLEKYNKIPELVFVPQSKITKEIFNTDDKPKKINKSKVVLSTDDLIVKELLGQF
jgi:hypothetical protein